MSIRLITFDLDDTFWNTAPVIAKAETELRNWLAANTPRLGEFSSEALATIRRQLVEHDPRLKHRVSELRRRILCHALEAAGYPIAEATELSEQAFQVFLAARHLIEVFPEVQPTLETLANRYTLAVLTNGNADVRRLGLADYFHFILCAEELGIGKPDPHPFQEALRRSGFSARQAVHIGDNPIDDIGGAQSAGVRAVWFNPGALSWQGDNRPDAEIRSLTEIPGLIESWAD
ncbi:HAD family hydrolase [Azomonas macrocytogenes]|uniref:Putative hydrolase of the HAD superfamily n=1 Tax=Azomonas macrocytogenes TaxID=69962 RepID=A0A839T2I4_AZOMA|nr:HAD-IA family hydrolase [Azomonas macrocytogenes]MBB3103318.1 putative hydrolase of the HAD superfamily [Azomonas macrocytogenes]